MSISPLVSICLPNYRNIRYLEERVRCILDQDHENWELVIYDNESDDGAWQFFERLEQNECRVRLHKAPRLGMYENWNNCIRAARGKYIYIATSDDAMPPDCLRILVDALERHPSCGFAHCPPKIYGDQPAASHLQQWWSTESPFARSIKQCISYEHIRFAPYDGYLHLQGTSVIISITQMLIRSNVFDRIGLFPNDVGVVGDFEWQARLAFLENSVFVPTTWGGWRVHSEQATAQNSKSNSEKIRVNQRLFERALEFYISHNSQRCGAIKIAGEAKKLARIYSEISVTRSTGSTLKRCAAVTIAIVRNRAMSIIFKSILRFRLLNIFRYPGCYIWRALERESSRSPTEATTQ